MGRTLRLAATIGLALVAVLLPRLHARAADAPPTATITLASTTSVDNSGLLAAILPEFTKTTGIAVRVLALGTGQALDTARRGDADIVLVHDLEAEAQFVAEGNGVDRKQIAWNDFIIVGPNDDPAHIGGSHNAIFALTAIATIEAPFVSRGDKSGTSALELRLWKRAGIEPKSGGWYKDIGGGMGQALNAAAAMSAYTLSDRGTWLSFKNKGKLRVMVEGDPALVNRYDVIELNPTTHSQAQLASAHRLAGWLAGQSGQAAIGAYRVDGEELFHPSAANPK
jgi:tungstate transport system substrate-binding protein